MKTKLAHTLIALIAASQSLALANSVDIGRFDSTQSALPTAWQVVRFDDAIPATRYRLLNWDGVNAIEAVAESSMALLARPLTVDLQKTPILCWRWRIDAPVSKADMQKKSGDDYAARVYIAFRLPADAIDFGTRIKLALGRSIYGDHVPDAAINYVWDNRYPIGTQQANAYTDRTQMLVLRSGNAEVKRWMTERRDVLADAQQAFGNYAISAASLAIASDTDNTQSKARAGFADLHFVARESACSF